MELMIKQFNKADLVGVMTPGSEVNHREDIAARGIIISIINNQVTVLWSKEPEVVVLKYRDAPIRLEYYAIKDMLELVTKTSAP